jgi:uncharacterized protein DUF4838/cellulose/xylan binding protein with CBM9 domain/glycosyl hydrolase family 67
MLIRQTVPKLIISLTLTLLLGCNAIGNNKFKRKIDIGQKSEINLANYNIVVPETASKVAVFAAKELQHYLSKSLGTKAAITKSPVSGKSSIIIGNSTTARKYGINIDSLPRDGFIIKTIDKNIIIVGKDDSKVDPFRALKQRSMWKHYYERATLFGVYNFLERFVGVRFYFPGEIGTVIPKHKTLTVPSINIADAPEYIARTYSVNEQWMDKPILSKDATRMRRYNTYRLRTSTSYIPNCHGLNARGYIKRYAKSNPEYFAMMGNGKRSLTGKFAPQLCFKSDIVDKIYEDAKAFFQGKSAASCGIITKWGPVWAQSSTAKGYYNIMPQDGVILCQCPKCKATFAKGGKIASDAFWDFFCGIAERLKKNNISGYITTMAYPPYEYVPERKIPDNVVVKLAVRGPWQEHSAKMQKLEDDRVKLWSKKVGGKLELWTYANKFSKLKIPGVPSFTPRCVGSYYAKQRDYILGAYMESESESFYHHYMNYYVLEKTCWNTSIDIDKLMTEHYKLMYGPAANIMQNIFDSFEKKWTGKIFGTPYNTPMGPKSAPASDYQIWTQIYSPAVLKKLDNEFTQAKNLVQKDALMLKRIKFMRREFLTPLQNESKKYFSLKNEISGMSFKITPKNSQDKIIIDGILNEKAWKKCGKVTLVPFQNAKGKKVLTTLYALKGKDKLYLAFNCDEPQMDKIFAGKRKKDDKHIWKDNTVEIFLNPSADKKHYYHFIINSEGSVSDAASQKKGAAKTENWKWNSGAEYKVLKAKNNWVIEISIPLKSIGKVKNQFPANFCRSRVLSDGKDHVIYYSWSPFLKKGFHDIASFGSIILNDEGAANNLLSDASFEKGEFSGRYLGKWYGLNTKLKNQSYSIDSTVSIAGKRSLKLNNTGNGKAVLSQPIAGLKPDTEYMLVYYVKLDNVQPNGTFPGVCANIWDGKNNWLPKKWFLGTMPWTKQVYKFKTSSKKLGKEYKGTFRLFLSHATGSAWFDNIKLYELK